MVFINGKAFGRTAQVVAGILGVDRGTYAAWRKRGCPGKSRKWWPVTDVIDWARENIWGAAPDGDELLSGSGNSPALEDYRRAKARLAEMDLAEKRGELLRREVVCEGLQVLASVLRSHGENMQRQFGEAGHQYHEELIDEIEDKISDRFRHLGITGSENPAGTTGGPEN